jgi:hypothetical protein
MPPDRDRNSDDAAELARSFQAVCLFSALGLLLSLIFLIATGGALDPDLNVLQARN